MHVLLAMPLPSCLTYVLPPPLKPLSPISPSPVLVHACVRAPSPSLLHGAVKCRNRRDRTTRKRSVFRSDSGFIRVHSSPQRSLALAMRCKTCPNLDKVVHQTFGSRVILFPSIAFAGLRAPCRPVNPGGLVLPHETPTHML